MEGLFEKGGARLTPSKRAFDICLALVLSVVLLPVMAGLICWLLYTQGGPVFHVAERMKTSKTAFRLWKFRTMTVAETDAGVTGGDKTNRITPAGRWLRKTRLDELPQLWNILRGDISFVGPRPPLREYVERFPELYSEVLQSRPGVTGLATIVYHHHESVLLARCASAEETDAVYATYCVPTKARLDLIYQDHQNLCFDVDLILQTVGGVFARQ